jgi:hypothetical protein
MYKNRKPFCDPFDASGAPEVGYCGTSSNAAPSLLTCSEDSDCPVDSGQVCLRFDGDNPLPDDNFGDRDRFDITRFGNSSRACVEDFFEFQHGYFCESDSPARFEVGVAAAQGLITGDDQLRLLAQGVEANDVVCVYKPKVQVKDNWGWCNGSCNGVGNTGCYSALSVGGECDPSESEPWTEYTGSIIVIPST